MKRARYNLVVYNFDIGHNELLDYPTKAEAVKAARAHVRMYSRDEAAVWDRVTNSYTFKTPFFPEN